MQTNINKPDSDKDVLFKMVDIEKSFPGVKALDHAQLTVRRERCTRLWEKTARASQLLTLYSGWDKAE